MALVVGGADDRRPGAGSALAAIAGRAGEAIVTAGSVRLGGIRAEAGRGVAGAGDVALVEGGADDRRPGAGSALAAVAGRAGEAIVTAGPVGLGGIRADPGRRVTRAGVMALVLGGADDRRPGAGSRLEERRGGEGGRFRWARSH